MLTHATRLSAADRRFLDTFLSDEEDAPWMSVTDWHLLALIAALLPLRWFAALTRPEWYIGSEIAVYFPVEGGKKFVVPDIFVALAPNHPRTSFDSEAEGGFPPFVLEIVSEDAGNSGQPGQPACFPPFVLEIVSEESRRRDAGPDEKVRLYGLLGAQEYVIFDPEGHVQPRLQGYRRTPEGDWARWQAGPRNELASGVLGLTLVADGTLLRLEEEGRLLLTPDEERLRAIHEHHQAQQERIRAEQERLRADQERARANAAEARIAELEAQLKRVQQPPL